MTIQLQDFVTAGTWKLQVDAEELASFEVEEAQENVELEWDEAQDWLVEPEGRLISMRSGRSFILVNLNLAQ
jgi:hypothetical protein